MHEEEGIKQATVPCGKGTCDPVSPSQGGSNRYCA